MGKNITFASRNLTCVFWFDKGALVATEIDLNSKANFSEPFDVLSQTMEDAYMSECLAIGYNIAGLNGDTAAQDDMRQAAANAGLSVNFTDYKLDSDGLASIDTQNAGTRPVLTL